MTELLEALHHATYHALAINDDTARESVLSRLVNVINFVTYLASQQTAVDGQGAFNLGAECG